MSGYLFKHLSLNFVDSIVSEKLIDWLWWEAMAHLSKVSL